METVLFQQNFERKQKLYQYFKGSNENFGDGGFF